MCDVGSIVGQLEEVLRSTTCMKIVVYTPTFVGKKLSLPGYVAGIRRIFELHTEYNSEISLYT